MNKDDAIARFETDADARKAGYTTKLTQQQAQHLLSLGRHERRAEFARMRRAERTARITKR